MLERVPTAVERVSTDDQLVALWLHGRPERTREAYSADIADFRAFRCKPFTVVTLADLQAYADTLSHLAPASQSRKLSAIKSLLTFGWRTGCLPVNVGAALRLPTVKATLAERILSVEEVQRLMQCITDRRDQLLVKLLYIGGLRASEACGLSWRDLSPKGEGGILTLQGKGGKTRAVLLPAGLWRELKPLTMAPVLDGPVFMSRTGTRLDRSAVYRIVAAAARRAGISGKVGPHHLRHSHASHALDAGAPISLVRDTLGHASIQTTGKYLHARPGSSSALYLEMGNHPAES